MAHYIDYCILDDFYTIEGACELLGMNKAELRKKSEQYEVYPHRSEKGEYGFSTHDIRKLHNYLYYEGRPNKRDLDEAWR